MTRDALALCDGLGYDLNTVEFAVRDGVPYAIDFMNCAPDADVHSVGRGELPVDRRGNGGVPDGAGAPPAPVGADRELAAAPGAGWGLTERPGDGRALPAGGRGRRAA